MAYKTVMLDYEPATAKMAEQVKTTESVMLEKGWKLVAFSVKNSARAILVFNMVD